MILFITLLLLQSVLAIDKNAKYYLIERGGSQDMRVLEEIFESIPGWKSAIEWPDRNDPAYSFIHSKVKRAYTHFRWITVSDIFMDRRSYSSHETVNRIPFRHEHGLCTKSSAFDALENSVIASLWSESESKSDINSNPTPTPTPTPMKSTTEHSSQNPFSCFPSLSPSDLEWVLSHTPLTFHPTRSNEDLEFFRLYLENLYSYKGPMDTQDISQMFSVSNFTKLAIYSKWIDTYPYIPSKWILKPAEGARGVGISIMDINSPQEIDNLFEYLTETDTDLIVQPYIPNPLLIHGHKFDIRQFVLLTELQNPNTLPKTTDKYDQSDEPVVKNKGFVFNDFYLRFSSVPFSIDDNDKFIHLTNHQIQKHNSAFHDSEHQDDSDIHQIPSSLQWSSNSFFTWLKQTHGENSPNLLTEKIRRLVDITLQSWPSCHLKNKAPIYHTRSHSFELLGFDILIDENLEPWLLEVNCNPGLHMLTPIVRNHHSLALQGMVDIVTGTSETFDDNIYHQL